MGAGFDIWNGHRIRLRRVTADDADRFFEDGRDSESARFAHRIELPQSKPALLDRLQAKPGPDDHNVWLALESVETAALVGSTNVHSADLRNRGFSYGIGIFEAERRKGYATEAVALLLRYYFRELGYHRVTADVYGFNERSLALHRRMGFVEEGRIRDSIYTDGRFWDELIFGMLASEFGELEKTLPPIPFKG